MHISSDITADFRVLRQKYDHLGSHWLHGGQGLHLLSSLGHKVRTYKAQVYAAFSIGIIFILRRSKNSFLFIFVFS